MEQEVGELDKVGEYLKVYVDFYRLHSRRVDKDYIRVALMRKIVERLRSHNGFDFLLLISISSIILFSCSETALQRNSSPLAFGKHSDNDVTSRFN